MRANHVIRVARESRVNRIGEVNSYGEEYELRISFYAVFLDKNTKLNNIFICECK